MTSNIIQNANLIIGIIFFIVALGCLNFLHLKHQEYRNTKLKFAFYALRDDLAFLVYDGKLKEDAPEFQQLRSSLNYSIASTDDFSVLQIAKMLVQSLQTESAFSQSLFHSTNSEVKEIASRYLNLNKDLLLKNSSPLFFFILGLFASLLSKNLAKPQEAIHRIDETDSKLQPA